MNKIPKALILNNPEYVKKLAEEVHKEVTHKLLKKGVIPICNLCLGAGYLYKGQSVFYYILESILNGFVNAMVGTSNTVVNDTLNKAMIMIDYALQQLEKGEEREIKYTGFKVCPVCKAKGTKLVYLKNFGRYLVKIFNDTNILKSLNKSDMNKIIREYTNNATYVDRKNRRQVGNYAVDKSWKSKYLQQLAEEVVGEPNIGNSFYGLIKKFSRVDTGAMKSGMFKKKKDGKFILSTTARKVSKKYPKGFLYASIYDNFGNKENKTWSKRGITTKDLFERALSHFENKYNLKELSSLNRDVSKLLRVFDYTLQN